MQSLTLLSLDHVHLQWSKKKQIINQLFVINKNREVSRAEKIFVTFDMTDDKEMWEREQRTSRKSNCWITFNK